MLCPRTTYIWACLLISYSGALKSQCKWCFDGTTFEISDSGHDTLVVIAYDCNDTSPIRDSSRPQSLPVYIKWMYLGSAYGEIAPLFLVFAVEVMEADQFHLVQVVGLSGTDVVKPGWVAFAKSRAGNAGLWKEFFRRFVIPTIENSTNVLNTEV